ncbi:24712_t:CDS:2, partial [Cetraspora pellucida]
SDENIDLMGHYLTLYYMAQLKWKKDGSYLNVTEMREFINTVRSRPKHELCLLITTATLSKHAENASVNFDEKEHVIICGYNDISQNIKKYEEKHKQALENKKKRKRKKAIYQKSKIIKLKDENEKLKKKN